VSAGRLLPRSLRGPVVGFLGLFAVVVREAHGVGDTLVHDVTVTSVK